MKMMWMATVIGMCIGGIVSAAIAAPAGDVVLRSADGCQMHYVTEKNTVGWRIDGQTGACLDGWIDGYAEVTISDAFQKPVEQVFGYFRNGFWVGSEPISFPVIDLSTPADGVRALSVALGESEVDGIRYVGQLRAERMADGSFGAFTGCPTARVLAVTDRSGVFEDETVQSVLLNEAIHQAQVMCPAVDVIYFYGASVVQPTDADVFFFAEIDLGLRQIQVRRLPSSAARRAEAARMARVRAEPSGVPIMRVTPIRPNTTSVEAVHMSEETDMAAVPVVDTPFDSEVPGGVETDVNTSSDGMVWAAESRFIGQTERMAEIAKEEAASGAEPSDTVGEALNNQAVATEDVAVPEVVYDAVPHLLTASRLLGKPVSGQAAVHVFRVDLSGQAWIDLPVPMKANGRLVQTGWNMVSGLFSAERPTGTKPGAVAPMGTIVMTDAVACAADGCFADPVKGEVP